VIHAVEIELPLIERGEERVGEVDVAIAPDDDVVGGVQTLAFELLYENFYAAGGIGPGDAARLLFARIQAALAVHGVSVGAVSVLAKDLGRSTGRVFIEAVPAVITKDQVTLARPYWPLAPRKTIGNVLDLEI
jgi:hypothetical protein